MPLHSSNVTVLAEDLVWPAKIMRTVVLVRRPWFYDNEVRATYWPRNLEVKVVF